MTLLRANPNYKPIARQELTPDQQTLLIDGFFYLANISKEPAGLDALTFLSTCPTHRHTYNACAFEVDQWLRGGDADFDILLSSLEQIHPDKLKAHPTLFDDFEDVRASVGEILYRLNPSLENCIRFCQMVLSEYSRKYKIFHERYNDLLQTASNSCNKTRKGKRFWELHVEGRNISDPSLDKDIIRRFAYLELAESLAWHLNCYTSSVLWKLGLLRNIHDGPNPINGNTNEFATAYNFRLTDSANICGLRIQTAIPDELINPNENQWRTWWEPFVECVRTCFLEIREFFDFYICRFSHDPFEPFLPDKIGDRTTITGCKEEVIHNAFVLFFDIIRSKVSPPEVKDAFAHVLRQTKSDVISPAKAAEASDDAFVVVTRSWEDCLDAARGCHNAAQAYTSNPNGFGGIRMTLEFGSLTVITRPNAEPMPRDSDVHPVIARAAYLADGVKKLLTKEEDFEGRIIVSDETMDHLKHIAKMEDSDFTAIVGNVEGKDNFSTRAAFFTVFPS